MRDAIREGNKERKLRVELITWVDHSYENGGLSMYRGISILSILRKVNNKNIIARLDHRKDGQVIYDITTVSEAKAFKTVKGI